ncbi:NAD(P)-binding domain-containing protein [Alphaproteobacteria bacterium]|nr:NAD(P)-binding domain-containing protein [Alphaproteobacteria bacterium]
MNNPIISVVGLGKMGLGIYKRLSHKNTILYGYDNNSKIIKNNTYINFLEIEKLLELSDLVLFVVPSNDEIFDIIEKYKLKKDSVFLDLTTSMPDQTIKIKKYLSNKNVEYFDAAMSGGANGANNGTLTLMVGAKEAQLNKYKSVLNKISQNIFFYGKVGTGHSMKLLHNSVCHGIFLMMCEIGHLGEEMGINLNDLIETFNVSNAKSFISEHRFPNHILNNKFDGNSYLKNLKKDLDMIESISNKSKNSNNYIQLTNKLLKNFNKNFDNHDFTQLYKLWQNNIQN